MDTTSVTVLCWDHAQFWGPQDCDWAVTVCDPELVRQAPNHLTTVRASQSEHMIGRPAQEIPPALRTPLNSREEFHERPTLQPDQIPTFHIFPSGEWMACPEQNCLKAFSTTWCFFLKPVITFNKSYVLFVLQIQKMDLKGTRCWLESFASILQKLTVHTDLGAYKLNKAYKSAWF